MPRVQVMIVDDHPVVRAGLCALVDGRETMTVAVEAGTGEEALLRLEEFGAQIDVIIMDLRMGAGMSGIEATRLIRERCDIPVLIMTAFDTQADVVAALKVGAIGYLLKDCPADEIARAVEDAAAGRSVLSPSVIAQMMKRIASPATALTPREIEILELLSGGATNTASWRAGCSSPRRQSRPTSCTSSTSSERTIGPRRSNAPATSA